MAQQGNTHPVDNQADRPTDNKGGDPLCARQNIAEIFGDGVND